MTTKRTLVSRMACLGVVSSFLLALFVVAPPAAANHESSVKLEWTGQYAYVDVKSAAHERLPDSKLGCAGSVQLTHGTTGNSQPFVGVGLGADCSLSNPPCAPFVGIPDVTCSSNDIYCCVEFELIESASGEIVDYTAGCIWQFYVTIDADGDHDVDSRTGPFWSFAHCGWTGEV